MGSGSTVTGNQKGEKKLMTIPNTYSEWLECFDLLKTGTKDAEVMSDMKQGSLTLSAGVAGRFATQMNEVIQYRITKLSDKFERVMKMNNGDLNLLSISLLAIRKEFNFLVQFACLPVLPSNHTELFVNAIKEQASTMQKSLESSANKTDRTGALTSIIKKNNIDKLEGI